MSAASAGFNVSHLAVMCPARDNKIRTVFYGNHLSVVTFRVRCSQEACSAIPIQKYRRRRFVAWRTLTASDEINDVFNFKNDYVKCNALHFPLCYRVCGNCNRICVKLLELMSGVIIHNSVKKRCLYINKWLSYSQLKCFTAAILSAILGFVIGFVSNF